MTSILAGFGFPPPEKRDIVRFHFAKGLPYDTRIKLTLGSLAAGFFLQALTMNFLYGIPFLVPAVGLVLVKGYDSRVRIIGLGLDPDRKVVPVEKIREIDRLRRRSRKWDRDALDISNPLGVFSMLFLAALVLILAYLLGELARDRRVSVILAVDAAVLMLPLWFSGMRFILKQPNLAVKVRIILKMHEAFEAMKKEGEEFRPSLLLARDKKGKSVPVDARFSIALPRSPEGFYGLQAQVNINVVQGASFPYFYCVLAAKPGFGIGRYRRRVSLRSNIICEYQEDNRAEVLVIRQHTTKKSGYHTKDRKCAEILSTALEAARLIC